MSKPNIVIVGAGLFGSIAATLARKHGYNATVVDNAEPYAASKASGCVLAPSWLSNLEKRQITGAMDVLRELYIVEEVQFKLPVGVFRAERVNPDKVLIKPDVKDAVTEVGNGFVKTVKSGVLRGKVLVAAGFWSDKLVEMPKIRGLYGASIRLTGVQLATPSILTYMPYRQAVAINLDKNTVWFGDGTALIQKTWIREEADRLAATQKRAAKILGPKLIKAATRETLFVGCRPYVEGYKAGYFAKVHQNTWVSTGGAKNGTVLAAWQALKFMEAL